MSGISDIPAQIGDDNSTLPDLHSPKTPQRRSVSTPHPAVPQALGPRSAPDTALDHRTES